MSPILRPYSIVKNKKEDPVVSPEVISLSDEKVKREMITEPVHSLNQECEGSLVLGDIETDESLIKEEESFLPSVSSDTFLPSVENLSGSLSEEGVFSLAPEIKDSTSSVDNVVEEKVPLNIPEVVVASELLTMPVKDIIDRNDSPFESPLVSEIIQAPGIPSQGDVPVTVLVENFVSLPEEEKVSPVLEKEKEGSLEVKKENEAASSPLEEQKITQPIVREETVVAPVIEVVTTAPLVKVESSVPIAIQIEHSSLDKKEEIISDALHQLLERKIERTEELAKASLENVSNVIVSDTTVLPPNQQTVSPPTTESVVTQGGSVPISPKISWFDKLFGSAPKTPPQAI